MIKNDVKRSKNVIKLFLCHFLNNFFLFLLLKIVICQHRHIYNFLSYSVNFFNVKLYNLILLFRSSFTDKVHQKK